MTLYREHLWLVDVEIWPDSTPPAFQAFCLHCGEEKYFRAGSPELELAVREGR